MKIKWGNVLALLFVALIIGALSFGFWLLKVWIASKVIGL